MKLNEVRPYLETSGDLEEQFFSIQDTGMIFDILRNKMYSNPILAIAREISCNARDAHREVGASHVPIHIHLPNPLEPEYKVKDFGPGISPDRMSNIFIKYTASTKRSDNIQTGGFGLGAKTPFSYSDSFSIATVFNGTKYLYNCVIDSTKVGKLMLAHEEPTTEPSGTEIIIPILPKNFNEFATWTEQACRHWKVKPIISGAKFTWNVAASIVEGNNWSLLSNNGYSSQHIKLIIDEIEYPLDVSVLSKYTDTTLIHNLSGQITLHFGVGELTLSASREQVYLDEKTTNLIKARLDELQKDIKQKLIEKIDNFPSYWSALVFFREESGAITSHYNRNKVFGTLTWKNLPLYDGAQFFNCPVYTFTKGKHSKKFGTDPEKLSRSSDTYLAFLDKSAVYINDTTLKEPTPRHVKKAFEDDPTLTSVQVICPTDKVTLDSLNTSFNLDKMGPKLLSSITKASARAYTPATSRLLVFKLDDTTHTFKQVSYSSIDDDTNNKVLGFVSKNFNLSRELKLSNNLTIPSRALIYMCNKFKNTSIYGIDTGTPAIRIAEDFSDFTSIEDFIKDNVTNSGIDFIKIKQALKFKKMERLDDALVKFLTKVQPMIDNVDSLFLKRLVLHKLIYQTAIGGDKELLDIYESLNSVIEDADMAQWLANNPDYNLHSMDTDFAQKYPLLPHISYYRYLELSSEIAHYVNLVDKQ